MANIVEQYTHAHTACICEDLYMYVMHVLSDFNHIEACKLHTPVRDISQHTCALVYKTGLLARWAKLGKIDVVCCIVLSRLSPCLTPLTSGLYAEWEKPHYVLFCFALLTVLCFYACTKNPSICKICGCIQGHSRPSYAPQSMTYNSMSQNEEYQFSAQPIMWSN